MYLKDIFHCLPISEKGTRKVTYQLAGAGSLINQVSKLNQQHSTHPGTSARPLSRTHLTTFAEGKPEPKLNTTFATSTRKSFRNIFGLFTRAFHCQKSCRVARATSSNVEDSLNSKSNYANQSFTHGRAWSQIATQSAYMLKHIEPS